MATSTGGGTRAARVGRAVLKPFGALGEQVEFYGRSYGYGVAAVTRYRREVLRLLAEVSLGSGALAVIGGTIVVVAGLNRLFRKLSAGDGVTVPGAGAVSLR